MAVRLVFHAASGDLRTLRAMGVSVPDWYEVLDTQVLYKAVTGHHQSTNLAKMCAEVGVWATCLHNAGNDSHATLQALFRIFERYE